MKKSKQIKNRAKERIINDQNGYFIKNGKKINLSKYLKVIKQK